MQVKEKNVEVEKNMKVKGGKREFNESEIDKM